MKHLLQYFTELSLHPKNAEELKGLILQLAIQGKLTAKWREENPDLEPATVLLERIQEEKAQLVKEKKIRKEKPLPKIDENEVLIDIPETWAFCRLGNIGDWGAGATPSRSRSDFYDGEINWFKSGELNDGIMDYDSKEKINELAIKNSSLRLNKVGDVLIAMYGATIGKTGLLKVEGTTNQAVCACTPFSCISNTYLHLLLKALKTVFSDQGEGGAQPNISRVKIRNQVFALPPLEEQKAIVAVVNQLFAEVEQLESLTKARIQLKEDFVTSALHQLSTGNTATEWAFLQKHFATFFTEESNIKKLRESILQLAVQGKLTHHWRADNPEVEDASVLLERIKEEKAQLVKAKKIKKEKPLSEITEEEMPYELPEGWVWCRPQNVTLNIVDCPHSTPKFLDEGKLCIDTTCMDNEGNLKYERIRKVNEETFNSRNTRLVPKEGDIIYAREGSIGKSIVIPKGMNVCLGQRVMIYRPHKALDSYYLRICLVSPMFLNQVLANHKGLGAKHVNMSDLRKMPIPLPPYVEQKAIVKKVNALLALCDQLEQAIQSSKATQEDWMKSSLREVLEVEVATTQ